MMGQLPINKILLAGFAFTLTHWRKIVEISLLPALLCAPFLLIAPTLFATTERILGSGSLNNIELPDNTIIYLLLFFYGYLTLSINMYRLVLLGAASVRGLRPILSLRKIARFTGLNLFIGLVTTIPAIITKQPLLQLIMTFLIIPITLNFVSIAIDQPIKYRWYLGFITQINLFFLQVVLPMLVTVLFVMLSSVLGLGAGLGWAVKVLMFYWTLITLALCYQLIQPATPQ